MKIGNETYEAPLSPELVDELSEKIRSFIKENKLSKTDGNRFALAAEEVLLESLQNDGAGTIVTFETGSKFLRPYFSISIKGKAQNLFAAKKGTQSAFANGIINTIGLYPEYEYSSNNNIYTFSVKRKKKNQFLILAVTILLALIVGTAGMLLPDLLRAQLLNEVLIPVHDTFLNILGAIAGPMIFLSVAWGIYGVGDAATLKVVGKRLMSGYIGAVAVSVIIAAAICVPVFTVQFSNAGSNLSEFSAIFDTLLGIFPKNIFSPFVDGNTLQIIFLGIIIGIAMLFLGQKTTAVAKAIEQINYVVQFLAEVISKLVPFFIFIVLVEMIWSDSLKIFSDVYKLFVVFIGLVLIFTIGFILYTSLRVHVKPLTLAGKGLPTLLIALSTASSAAALASNLKATKEEYGIDETINSFGVPLGMVTYKVSTALNYLVMTFFFAEMYNVEISVAWILTAIFSSIILAVATPTIPGGALASYTVLFLQLGIPQNALVIALACDTIFDFIATGTDQFMMPFALLIQARKLGLVDEKILNKEPKKNKK